MLDQYMDDIQTNQQQDQDMARFKAFDRIISYTPLDFVYPWHMKLTADDDREFGIEYTPFKTFYRRRNYLIWLYSKKFESLLTAEERARRDHVEKIVFYSSTGLKLFGVFLFMNLRFYKRPVGRSFAYDFLLVYLGTYAILGSNVPAIHATWPMYRDLA